MHHVTMRVSTLHRNKLHNIIIIDKRRHDDILERRKNDCRPIDKKTDIERK